MWWRLDHHLPVRHSLHVYYDCERVWRPLTVRSRLLCAHQSGEMEDGMVHFMDRNQYIDHILACVLRDAGKRRVVMSCFDPDICTMWAALVSSHTAARMLGL